MGSTISSVPHWHLVLNHAPTVGTVIGLGLLLCALYLKSDDVARVTLALFVIVGLIAIPTYVTGAAAALAIRDEPSVSADSIAAHQDAALLALVALLLTGWMAWFALWQYRRFSRPYRRSVSAVLVMAAISLVLMIPTAMVGGSISHPEIRSGEAATSSGLTAAVAAWVFGGTARWPTLEAVHFLGMSMLFGVVLLIVMRVFGIGRSVPFAALHRLLPLGVFGFVLNVASGMLFFIADSDRYSAMTIGFFPKMGLVVIGGVALLYFTLFDEMWELRAGDDAPLRARVMAVATILLWSGVIVYGRLLPYLEGG